MVLQRVSGDVQGFCFGKTSLKGRRHRQYLARTALLMPATSRRRVRTLIKRSGRPVPVTESLQGRCVRLHFRAAPVGQKLASEGGRPNSFSTYWPFAKEVETLAWPLETG